jgi:hypothetical protein
LQWDLEVDIVCTGSGATGLAAAIATIDVGGDVFVAEAPDQHRPSSSVGDSAASIPAVGSVTTGAAIRVDPDLHMVTEHRYQGLAATVSDAATTGYLAALSADLVPVSVVESTLPISVVADAEAPTRRAIPPFVGAQLRDWAARCLASPYGFLHTRVSDWRTVTMQTATGECIEVAEVGSLTPDPVDIDGSVLEWLTVEAHDRGIVIEPDSSLHRIVFEEGDVVGAVITTPDGPLAIRTRHGVMMPTNGAALDVPPIHVGATEMQVCLVSRHASRFGRLELLTHQPPAHRGSPPCGRGNRRLHANLHETQADSPVWRCARQEGYPLLDH